MKKEELQARLESIDADIKKNIDEHNEIVKSRDEEAQKKLSYHNVLCGRREEVSDQLAKLEEPEA